MKNVENLLIAGFALFCVCLGLLLRIGFIVGVVYLCGMALGLV